VKNVLVTGGTDFLGIEVIRQLSEAGIRPRVLVWRPHRVSAALSTRRIDVPQAVKLIWGIR
jgi:nucleoside-diphosphate-sugar epimerase